MTTTDSYILVFSALAIIAVPLTFCAGAFIAYANPVPRCCACGKACSGLKCAECADLKPETL